MGKRAVTQKLPQWRFRLTLTLLLGLVALLTWRVLCLQVLDTDRGYEFLQDQGDARTVRTERIPAYRGVITDRNGEPLAVSTPVASIWINPRRLETERDRWAELATGVGITYAALAKKITDNSSRQFIYLQRHMAPADAEKVMALHIPGVNVQREYKRYYPAGEVAAHVVGFTNIDDSGQEGVELAYNDWLKGQDGSKVVLKDLHGNAFRDIGQASPAISGKDLMLSIDIRLQHLAYRELKAAMKRYSAKSGSIVMLDSHTGEILAMANQPSFNPNNRSDMRAGSMRNRAMTDVFEPGSTVKPFTVVAALESGRYNPHTRIDTSPGYIRVGSKTLLDPVNYGVIDLTRVLTKSSQVGTSKIALDLDEQDVRDVFSRFGLGASTGSGFPGESAGILPDRSSWRDIERVNFAFGYGLAVTPLQLAQAYAVFANQGVFKHAVLLRDNAKGKTDGSEERVVSAKIAGEVATMLQTVTQEGGTATRAEMPIYTAAGKTGTVHKVGKQGGYADNRYMAIFAGMAPATDPRLVTVVVIDEPELKKYHGGQSAAPVFSRVVSHALRILDVMPDKGLSEQHIAAEQPDSMQDSSQLRRRKSA